MLTPPRERRPSVSEMQTIIGFRLVVAGVILAVALLIAVGGTPL